MIHSFQVLLVAKISYWNLTYTYQCLYGKVTAFPVLKFFWYWLPAYSTIPLPAPSGEVYNFLHDAISTPWHALV